MIQLRQEEKKRIAKSHLYENAIAGLNDEGIESFDLLKFLSLEGIVCKDYLEAYEFLGYIHQCYCEDVSIQNTNYRKHNGIYYTELSIAKKIVSELFEQKENDFIQKAFFLEPCVGGGIFVLCFLDKFLDTFGWKSQEEVQKLIDRVFCADIDKSAIELTQRLIKYHILKKTGFLIDIGERNFYIGNMLFSEDCNGGQVLERKLEDVFGIKKVDVIVTNPPYKLVKMNSNKYVDKEKLEDFREYNALLELVGEGKHFSLQRGVCNLYKLFCEEILVNYLANGGFAGLLIPGTFLNDQSCIKLREFLFEKFQINTIRVIPEKNNFFPEICQSFCFFTATSTGKTKKLSVIENVVAETDFDRKKTEIDLSTLQCFFEDLAIVALPPVGFELLHTLTRHKCLAELDYIVNQRGELDLTFFKSFITKEKTTLPLITGRNISPFNTMESGSFVQESFLDKIVSKSQFVNQPRLVCQQISNMHQKHRLKFSLLTKKSVLANSCNFLAYHLQREREKQLDELFYLLGLLNSLLLDWQFRLTSSNNHINNYELDTLRIAQIDNELKKEIISCSKDLCSEKDLEKLAKLNVAVGKVYGLSPNQWEYLLDYYSELQPELTIKIKTLIYANGAIAKSATNEDNSVLDSYIGMPNLNATKKITRLTKGKKSTHVQPFFQPDLFGNDDSQDSKVTDEGLTPSVLEKQSTCIKEVTIYNHETYPLSETDMRMVVAIPPGGNWKNIPLDIPSKRLDGIRTSGGRTTLYGRLKWNEPGYTITTFFNRPGNGCYIHPNQNRVISAREAARLQSFPDNYIFKGTKTSLCKQIGNAVPPLMAFCIARKIKEETGCHLLMDLFCGAGGLSVGFCNAGFSVILANDNFHYACETYRFNHPQTCVIEGDITQSSTKEKLVQIALEKGVDIIVGGPPCQGFSYAGYRMIDDPRNFLYKEYVEIVSKVSPRVVVIENVEGILTSNQGKTFQSICADFNALGYKLHGEKLLAAWFGVPQKRKRVIIVGVKDGNPQELFPTPLTTNEQDYTSVQDAIGNLPPIPVGGGASVMQLDLHCDSEYQKLVSSQISFDEFCSAFTKN